MAMRVCVTGGTGYIASWIIFKLLERGYHVHTTVRDPFNKKKIDFLWQFPGAKERLKIFKADLLEEGSFDSALEGVHGVFHPAGPVVIDPNDDPQVKLVETSLKGNLNVLKSCTKYSSIKRIILTSSCSAIRYNEVRDGGSLILDESIWSDTNYCIKHKLWYALAKTVAEQRSWEFAKSNNLDLIVVNASYVIGPLLQSVPTSTIHLVMSMLKGDIKVYPNSIMGFVHIHDVVQAHVLVYETPSVVGRYICSGQVAHWREVIEMLRARYPSYSTPTRPSEDSAQNIPHTIDTRKIQELGLIQFKTLEEMLDDCIHSLRLRGFLT